MTSIMLNRPLQLSEESALYLINVVENNIKYDSARKKLVFENLDDHNTMLLVRSAVETLGGSVSTLGEGNVGVYNPEKFGAKLVSLGVNFKGCTDLPTTNAVR